MMQKLQLTFINYLSASNLNKIVYSDQTKKALTANATYRDMRTNRWKEGAVGEHGHRIPVDLLVDQEVQD